VRYADVHSLGLVAADSGWQQGEPPAPGWWPAVAADSIAPEEVSLRHWSGARWSSGLRIDVTLRGEVAPWQVAGAAGYPCRFARVYWMERGPEWDLLVGYAVGLTERRRRVLSSR
jgi:hypothetical protein